MTTYRAEFVPGDPDPTSPYYGPCWYAWLDDGPPQLAGVGATWAAAKAEADANLHDTQARQIRDAHQLMLIQKHEQGGAE